MRSRRIATKLDFKLRRFVSEFYAVVLKKFVICVPGFHLRKNFRAHHTLGGEQSKQAHLRHSAKTDTGLTSQRVEPAISNGMVNMSSSRGREPDVNIREKE